MRLGCCMGALTQDELAAVFFALRTQLERVVTNRVGCPATAADLVQDMYLRLPRIGERLANADEARRYLLKMAVNAALNHLRLEGRRGELLAGIGDLYDIPEPTPEEVVLAGDEIRVVDQALRELPEKCREMLYLSRVEGLTHAEIARQMGVSQSLVEKYLIKAILHCRARLVPGP